MAPKIKVTKENILDTAIGVVRESGEGGLNVRAVAKRLGVSTQPIFSNYESMEALREDVLRRAYEIYTQYTKQHMASGKYPPYKASGMAYIQFANEEKELFKLLFMRNRTPEEAATGEIDGYILDAIQGGLEISREEAKLLHLEMWCFTHGVAVMYATSYLKLEMQLVSQMITDVYNGLKNKYTGGI